MPKRGKKQELDLHKIIIVGSGGVGKSALTLMFMYGDFVEEYDPTSADSYRKPVVIDDQEMNVDILDTAGQEDYAAMRDNYYRTGEGFMCVYAINLEDSFEKLETFFEQILRVTDKESVPFVLVGNKCDLGDDQRQVSKEKGQELADKYGCKFLETSAKLNKNVEEAYYTLIQETIKSKSKDDVKEKKKSGCVLL